MTRLSLNQPVTVMTTPNFPKYGRVTATGKQCSMVCTTANRYMWVSNTKLIPIAARSLQKCGGG